MSDAIRVVVCDDSRTYVQALTRVLEADGDIDVVRSYSSAERLLRGLVGLRPDLITMDLDLPGMDGVEATRRIMDEHPVPVVVVSALTGAGSVQAAEALAAGAVDVIHKEEIQLGATTSAVAATLRRRMRRLSRVRVTGRTGVAHVRGAARASARRARPATPDAAASAARPRAAPWRPHAIHVIGIAASTGGPSALRAVLGALPAQPAVPVLVVQHMTEGFTEGLGRWLDATVPPPVRLATEGAQAVPGVWLAPDRAHLVVGVGLQMHLDDRTPPDPHRPSGDMLFRSLARDAGAGAAVAVLTGMGVDGAAGVAAVLAAGGLAIAQDAASCAVDGMPLAAVRAGAQRVLPLDEIGPALAALPVRSRPR
ncbi:chemotaxis protein CheB [Capillimicrobium parvum]|uniref:protein-glutamate methylesterase n=1 Tax=Capillimicrobium parvum TaxID=2884022 RepID=A0A9E6XVJ4_9ACTN|nr:chemotaxis protein CheB [Capillimicrobium parvum]UGS34975.1 Protein-glutamate methylesterase/protein-glutamine glutaminase of group 3 operon [Capillimicrobium parvum]